QQLLRLIVDHVSVTGWQVEIHLRIPLDDDPRAPSRESNWRPHYGHRRRTTRPPRSDEGDAAGAMSSKDGLRSLRRLHVAGVGGQHGQQAGYVLPAAVPVDEGAHGEGVPQIMYAGVDALSAQPDRGGDVAEDRLGVATAQRAAGDRHEEPVTARRGAKPIACR